MRRAWMILAAMFLIPAMVFAGTVNLAWDAPADTTGITEYKIYWGSASGSYSQSATVPTSQLTYSATGLGPGTWFFAATSLAGTLESAYSNEVSATILPPPPVTLRIVSQTASRNPGGNKAVIEWSTNMLSNGIIEWGPTMALGYVKSTSALSYGHTFDLTRIDKHTPYYYRVRSRSNDGQEIESGVGTF